MIHSFIHSICFFFLSQSGKILCRGCICASSEANDGVGKCPFCRSEGCSAEASDEQIVHLIYKRIDDYNDREAMNSLGVYYLYGNMGLPMDENRAFDLISKAAKLGCADAYDNLGNLYYCGQGCQRNASKSKHYYELAAIGGNVRARSKLGGDEDQARNYDRAVKHWMISAARGDDTSMKSLKALYTMGHVTKDDLERAFRAHKEAKDSMKSKERDEAWEYGDQLVYPPGV